jgi:small subunit ribosomal protein S8e
MGISRDHWHKRRATGGKRKPLHKKRKYELGRPAANTKVCQAIKCACNQSVFDFQLGAKRVHLVRCRGGNIKHRALRLEAGNFAWGSESECVYVEGAHIL